MKTDLTIYDVLTYFFEEIFRDGIYEDDEKEMIMQLRREFNISPDKYLDIMKHVDQRFKNEELEYRERSIENDNKEIYTKILVKAFEDKVITSKEEEMVLKIAGYLSISNSVHQKIKKDHNLSTEVVVKEVIESKEVIEDICDDADSLLTEEDIISFLEMG